MAQIAALLHRAADLKNEREEPTTKRIKYLLPKPALSLREPRPQQWANMVQQAWSNVQHNSIASCKAQVLGKKKKKKKNSLLSSRSRKSYELQSINQTISLSQKYFRNGHFSARASSR